MIQAIGVIPARYQSSRFPGKPLAEIQGKPMIQRVYEQAQKASFLSRLFVATDDRRIFQACQSFGAEVLMTSSQHKSGTERAAEVAQKFDASIVINIQGDEPLLKGEMLDSLVSSIQDNSIPMATLATRSQDFSLLREKSVVKVVVDKKGFALYFSRSPLPFDPKDYFLQHIGIYAYQKEFLLDFSHMPPSRLENEPAPFAVSGLAGAHAGAALRYRFHKNFGLFAAPEFDLKSYTKVRAGSNRSWK